MVRRCAAQERLLLGGTEVGPLVEGPSSAALLLAARLCLVPAGSRAGAKACTQGAPIAASKPPAAAAPVFCREPAHTIQLEGNGIEGTNLSVAAAQHGA